MDEKERKEFNCRLANCEKNLALLSVAEEYANRWRDKVDRALFGKNGDSGMVDQVRDMQNFKNKFVKIISWITALIIAPLLASVGYLTIKILAHIDQIIKIVDRLQ